MRVILATILTAAALALPVTAQACSCLRYESAQEHMQKTDVIFEGVAGETRPLPDTERSRPFRNLEARTPFRVTRAWKGDAGENPEIWHPVAGPACGVGFASGSKVHIFARRLADGSLTTTLCDRPQFDWAEYEAALAEAAED